MLAIFNHYLFRAMVYVHSGDFNSTLHIRPPHWNFRQIYVIFVLSHRVFLRFWMSRTHSLCRHPCGSFCSMSKIICQFPRICERYCTLFIFQLIRLFSRILFSLKTVRFRGERIPNFLAESGGTRAVAGFAMLRGYAARASLKNSAKTASWSFLIFPVGSSVHQSWRLVVPAAITAKARRQ